MWSRDDLLEEVGDIYCFSLMLLLCRWVLFLRPLLPLLLFILSVSFSPLMQYEGCQYGRGLIDQEVVAELEYLGGMMQEEFGVISLSTVIDFENLFPGPE